MKVITYLGFTLISILVQFTVMDLIQEKLQSDENKSLVSHVTSSRKQFRDILQEYSNKPHALYYHTGLNNLKEYKNITTTPKYYSNTTLMQNTIETTTDTLSTTFEEVYDESASVVDIDTSTESFYTSTDIDNVTEIVLFEKKNSSINKVNPIPKRTVLRARCDCNLLFKVCDINCCCDDDCSETEINMFQNCDERDLDGNRDDVCYPQFGVKKQTSSSIGGLFCIVKTNLPERRNINNKYDREFATFTMEQTIKWQKIRVRDNYIEFMKKQYSFGDPIWLLINGTVMYLDVSSPVVNNYCTGRKTIEFLKDETIQCNVKLMHWEMIQILKTVEESTVISATDRTPNASVLNCSNVYCTNWTVIICNDTSCTAYNKSIHEPFCTDTICSNIALKVEYIFYYYGAKILNATVKMHTQNVSMTMPPHMIQDISVRFYIANTSIEETVQFSGAPGYIPGLPVIVSYAESNHTDHFFNSSSLRKHLDLPINQNGKCTVSNTSKNILKFGSNKRAKCRLILEQNLLSYNASYACKMVHRNIQKYLGMNYSISVSPYGNPLGQRDDQWLPLQVQNIEEDSIHGEFTVAKSTLTCRNIFTDMFIIFTYADQSVMNDKIGNKIITATVQMTQRNATFNEEDFSIVLTVDTAFVDITKPPVYEFAGAPNFNIHLPADFFFPFPNRASINSYNFLLIIILIGVVLLKIKSL